MSSASASAPAPDLAARLDAAAGLRQLAEGRLPVDDAAALADVVARARARLGVAGDHTVVAVAGPTGVGKSTLVNTLLDVDLAEPGVERPTTSQPLAVVVGEEPLGALATHMALERWAHVPPSGPRNGLEGLVLVDLPDHDSVVDAHRERAAELVAVADRLVWVVDPEKYADASVHDDLLAPLHAHGAVLTVVCNRIDRVPLDDRTRLLGDLRGLLRARGLGSAEVLATSARDGTGLAQLRERLVATVGDRRAVATRLVADLHATAARLDEQVPAAPPERAPAGRDELVDAALVAAGVPGLLDAAAADHRHRARRATGWPPLRRLQARGRTPLARLGLGRERERGETGTRSSRPLPQGVATAHVAAAARRSVDATTDGWPHAWAAPVHARVDAAVEDLPVALDRAVTGADLDDDHTPGWWGAVGSIQWLLVATLVVGLVWLATLFGFQWLQLPPPPVPHLGALPLPTVLVLGAVVLGLLVGAGAALAAGVGARRAASRVRRSVTERVATAVDERLLDLLDDERSRARAARRQLDLVAAPEAAAGGRTGGRWGRASTG